MSLIQSLKALFKGATQLGLYSSAFNAIPPPSEDAPQAILQYRALRRMYDSNGLYDDLAYFLATQGEWTESLKALRNPSNRVVEFYAAKLMPGGNLAEALPIKTDNKLLPDAINRVWTWSNWAAQKQVYARTQAIYGDAFIKIVGRQDPARVSFQLIQPEMVTEIDVDERGYLTHVRIDVPVLRRQPDDTVLARTVTEIWDKATDTFRIWEHEKSALAPPRDLGTPRNKETGILETTGVNFLPITQAKFRDIGDLRGQGSFEHAFDKIVEADRSATHLHQLLFRHNDVTWALASNGVDANMAPLVAPQIEIDGEIVTGGSSVDLTTLTLGGERFVRLPGNATLQSLVPDVHYAEALAVLMSHIGEVERDLPELTYSKLPELGEMSGIAIRRIMSAAIDRVLEARGNAEAALIRTNQIAISIGQAMKVPGFAEVGRYEDGKLDHSFESRPVIPTDELEDAQADLAKAQAALVRKQLGVSDQQLLAELGYQKDVIERMAQENEDAQANLGPTLIEQFNRGNPGGGAPIA